MKSSMNFRFICFILNRKSRFWNDQMSTIMTFHYDLPKKKRFDLKQKKKEKMFKFSLLSHVIVIRSMSPDESERFFCENDKKKKKMSSFYAAEHSIIKCTAMNLTAMTIFGWPLAHLHNQSFFSWSKSPASVTFVSFLFRSNFFNYELIKRKDETNIRICFDGIFQLT